MELKGKETGDMIEIDLYKSPKSKNPGKIKVAKTSQAIVLNTDGQMYNVPIYDNNFDNDNNKTYTGWIRVYDNEK